MANHSREASYDYPEFMIHYFHKMYPQAMKIPSALAEKCGNLPQTIKLEGPGGRTWRIVVTKVGGDFFFQDGWSEFVRDLTLQDLDFLIFTYFGSKFYVKIFGKNGSKKLFPPCFETDRKVGLNDQTVLSGNSTCNRVIPQFEVILNRTYVNKHLTMTKLFSLSHVKTYYDNVIEQRGQVTAILQIQDKSWEVNLSQSGCRYQFGKGWQTFVKENFLEEGDHCKFELIKRNPFVLKITVTKIF